MHPDYVRCWHKAEVDPINEKAQTLWENFVKHSHDNIVQNSANIDRMYNLTNSR
jgi:hypothetical protein